MEVKCFAVGSDVAGQRTRVRLHVYHRISPDGVENVAREAHVNHLLEGHGFDELLGLGVGAGADRIERVEIGRECAELDSHCLLQHLLSVGHGMQGL